MKKKLLIAIAAFAMLTGTSYAATTSVSVLVNGSPVQSGQLIDGSTMLPLRAISEALGVDVQWDNVKKQASVTTPPVQIVDPPPVAQSGLSLEQLNKIGESVGLVTALDTAGQPVRSGSGFILDGNLVTNHHVVEGSASLEIIFGTKETIVPSNYVFDDAEKDLAAVKYDGVSLKLNTNEPIKGDKVYTLGFPDKRFMISEGEIMFASDSQIIHSAPTDYGSSGGAIIDSSGNVIGLVVGGSENGEINKAIPAITLQEELNK